MGNALGGQQLFESDAIDEVAADGVLQLGLPVDLDGAGEMTAVVSRGVFVDLDENHTGSGQVLLCPFGGDEGGLATHTALLAGDEVPRRMANDGREMCGRTR